MLRVAPGEFDVGQFEALVAEGRGEPGPRRHASASAELREALSLWRGDAYAEFADEDWAARKRSDSASCDSSRPRAWLTPTWRAAGRRDRPRSRIARR